jgi:3-deoxy-manno-octulosonate cytidylyltransferase (CMP-KDO synthetase)
MKILVLDVDGTLTDGGLYYDNAGQDVQKFHVRDGMYLKLIQELGFVIHICSGRTTEFVKKRFAGFNDITYHSNVQNKLDKIRQIIDKEVSGSFVVAIGDDLNDIDLFKFANLSFAVKDAVEELKQVATKTLSINGGCGVLYEVWGLLKSNQNEF